MAALPVIDLAQFSDQNQRKDILEASRYWGCFRVINHSIPGPLQSQMKASVRTLFDLPDDVKRRNADVIHGSGYVGPTPKRIFFVFTPLKKRFNKNILLFKSLTKLCLFPCVQRSEGQSERSVRKPVRYLDRYPNAASERSVRTLRSDSILSGRCGRTLRSDRI